METSGHFWTCMGLRSYIASFHPEILYFRMLKLMVFFPETRSFFLLARKSSNYEEAYLNTLTNNCADWRSQREKEPFPDEN